VLHHGQTRTEGGLGFFGAAMTNIGKKVLIFWGDAREKRKRRKMSCLKGRPIQQKEGYHTPHPHQERLGHCRGNKTYYFYSTDTFGWKKGLKHRLHEEGSEKARASPKERAERAIVFKTEKNKHKTPAKKKKTPKKPKKPPKPPKKKPPPNNPPKPKHHHPTKKKKKKTPHPHNQRKPKNHPTKTQTKTPPPEKPTSPATSQQPHKQSV